MTTDPSKPVDLELDFLNDIKDPKFTRYIFLTYGLSDELLSLLPPNSRALIFYNKKAKNELKFANANCELAQLNNHAKIYCMWGSNKIKCWLGSFNLTKRGISRSIEWAANFEGNIAKPNLELEEITNQRVTEISDNITINQIVDLVSKVINKENPIVADRLFQTSTTEQVLLHNQFTNTIFQSVARIAEKAKKNVTITYITPFVNKTGIENFTKLFSPKFHSKLLSFCLMTNMPDENSSEGTFLNSQAIVQLKTNFNEFVMLKRNKEKESTLLRNGAEISSDPLHMKLINISFKNTKGEVESQSIFTSANLTSETWKSNHENIEIGIWIKEKADNEIISSFIDDFKHSFSEPDQQELKIIDKIYDLTKTGKFEELWIEDLVKERLSMSKSELRIDWPEPLPEIRNATSVFVLKNILTGERHEESVSLNSQNRSLHFPFPKSLADNKNTIIEYVRFSIETSLHSPMQRLRKQFIKFLSPEFFKLLVECIHRIDSQCNEVIIGNTAHPISNYPQSAVQDLTENGQVIFINRSVKAERVSFYVEFNRQPHFSDKFFINSNIDLIQLTDLGDFFKVSLMTDINIEPTFDGIEFHTADNKLIEPAAYSQKGNQIDYYFSPNAKCGLRLTARAGIPYNKYFISNSIELVFPRIVGKENSCFWKDAFGFTIPGVPSQFELNKLISPGTLIKISADHLEDSPAKSLKKGYFWKEESLSYNQPVYNVIEVPIKCSFPYSRIAYWGVLETQNDGVQLLSTKQTFTIKNVIVKNLKLSESIISSLSFITGQLTLGWILVDPEKFELSNEVRLKPDTNLLDLEVWQNGNKMKNETFRILKQGCKWVVPIVLDAKEDNVKNKKAHEHYDETDFQFLLTIRDERYLDYASTFENRSYILQHMRSGLKLGREPPSPLVEYYSIFLRQTKSNGFCFSSGIVSNDKLNRLDRKDKAFFKLSDGNLFLVNPRNKNEAFVFSLLS
jgi:hypothetical protein